MFAARTDRLAMGELKHTHELSPGGSEQGVLIATAELRNDHRSENPHHNDDDQELDQ